MIYDTLDANVALTFGCLGLMTVIGLFLYVAITRDAEPSLCIECNKKPSLNNTWLICHDCMRDYNT